MRFAQGAGHMAERSREESEVKTDRLFRMLEFGKRAWATVDIAELEDLKHTFPFRDK